MAGERIFVVEDNPPLVLRTRAMEWDLKGFGSVGQELQKFERLARFGSCLRVRRSRADIDSP